MYSIIVKMRVWGNMIIDNEGVEFLKFEFESFNPDLLKRSQSINYII